MADYTISITNGVSVVGGKPSQKWGATDNMTWGTSLWGTKGDFLEIQVEKVVTNSLTLNDPVFIKDATYLVQSTLSLSDAYTKDIGKAISEALTIADDFVYPKTISEALTLTSDITVISLQDAAGYYYVFARPTTNSDERVDTSYSSASAGSTSFTSLSGASTTWS